MADNEMDMDLIGHLVEGGEQTGSKPDPKHVRFINKVTIGITAVMVLGLVFIGFLFAPAFKTSKPADRTDPQLATELLSTTPLTPLAAEGDWTVESVDETKSAKGHSHSESLYEITLRSAGYPESLGVLLEQPEGIVSIETSNVDSGVKHVITAHPVTHTASSSCDETHIAEATAIEYSDGSGVKVTAYVSADYDPIFD